MIYNCFISNNSLLSSKGNPAAVFFGERSYEEMHDIAIKVGTPISCFAKIMESEVVVDFFAPNGKKENFCGHGLVGLTKALKDKGFGKNFNIKIADVSVKAEILENGFSSLQIGAENFNVSSFNNASIIEKLKSLFNLKDNLIEIFTFSALGDLLVEVNNYQTLRKLSFKKEKVSEFLKQNNIRILSFFSKDSGFALVDVEVRVFYVNLENLEDIACGSVNISLAKILHQKYGLLSYKAVQPYEYNTTGKIGGYQEIEYNPQAQYLTLKGMAENTKERFVFSTVNVEFNKNLTPKEESADYKLLKEIFTDLEVMKTSTAFGGGLAKNDRDLHQFMYNLIEQDKNLKNDYGLKKVWSLNLCKYVGVMGLIRTGANLVEGAIFLKSEHIGSGIGFWMEKRLFENLDALNDSMIASVWESNTAAMRLMEKNGMVFVKKTTKTYQDKTLTINIYTKAAKDIAKSTLFYLEKYLIINKSFKVRKAS